MSSLLIGPRLGWLRNRDWEDGKTLLHEEISPATGYTFAAPADCWITLDFDAITANSIQLKFRMAEEPALDHYNFLQDEGDLYLNLVTFGVFTLLYLADFYEADTHYHCVIEIRSNVLRLDVNGVNLFASTGAFLLGFDDLELTHDYGEENTIELRVYV